MKLIVKVFAEITLKSRPVRKNFIRQLGKNIRSVLRDLDPNLRVKGIWDNVAVETDLEDSEVQAEMISRLTCVPGIGYFLEVHEYPLGDLDDILEKTKAHYADQLAGRTFCVRCKRAGKHDFTSLDVERYVGGGLNQQCCAAGVSLRNPEIEVRLEIKDDHLFVVDRQHQGIGGYPLGALEQTLVLMSGGYDSTVAAFRMMRRGLLTHFCFFNLGGRAHELGVMEVAHYLWYKFGRSHRVRFISVPFEEVVGEILTKVDDRLMGVVLKRMMLRAASHFAEQLRADALVTGEAISQVSSQTLPNLSVIDRVTDTLVLRPLIASHKQNIIDTARQIGTADFAMHMPEYCGVISVNPSTKAKLPRVEYEEKQFDFTVLEKAIEQARETNVDAVIDELGRDIEVEQVGTVLPGQIVVDIRHPDEVESQPLALSGIEVLALPFYAINSRFKDLDSNRQYLLYCDRGVMSRLHVFHLLSEGHQNVRVYRP